MMVTRRLHLRRAGTGNANASIDEALTSVGGAGGMSAEARALVSVVDDDPSVRRSLARLVKAAGYEVETFASAWEFIARPPHEGPACLLLDVRMPGLTGLDLQERLAIAAHWTPIIFISGYRDVHASVKAMKAGAVDFLTKPVGAEELLGAIERAVARARAARREEDRVTEIHERIRTLTPREAEVFALVVAGMLNKQIAFDLGVSEKMVKVHRGRVMCKMHVQSLAELVRLAVLAESRNGDRPTRPADRRHADSRSRRPAWTVAARGPESTSMAS
jgi:FixJ family two-component response regulator